ncbi:hypothetical protein CONPUDRAFT_150573 [Coniophora puteana RWD-64-598 SS2]|uniref:Uncharacterized protein n=1 Tax=Coniophora puteana (strain RWD-64-598) TaxID=741705 RepID=A0A5M3N315_CONPW|nr:uncharacterized protein CONPUDRAFT_150573 [Coniophora puteana RWD-64-598 SS2]EIW85789.1 hypothetical protein CONPUDRAFT_150573 [Coniophora puteana RWD-64-598 SS2]
MLGSDEVVKHIVAHDVPRTSFQLPCCRRGDLDVEVKTHFHYTSVGVKRTFATVERFSMEADDGHDHDHRKGMGDVKLELEHQEPPAKKSRVEGTGATETSTLPAPSGAGAVSSASPAESDAQSSSPTSPPASDARSPSPAACTSSDEVATPVKAAPFTAPSPGFVRSPTPMPGLPPTQPCTPVAYEDFFIFDQLEQRFQTRRLPKPKARSESAAPPLVKREQTPPSPSPRA